MAPIGLLHAYGTTPCGYEVPELILLHNLQR